MLRLIIPFFQNIIEVGDDAILKNITEIITYSWLDDEAESYNLLNSILIKSSKSKSVVVEIAVKYMFDEKIEIRQKCQDLYKRFLNETSEDLIHAYSITFLHIPQEKFHEIYPLLKFYANSESAKKSPHYFYEYLLKCVKTNPTECLELVSNYNTYDKPDITKSGYYDDDPIKIVIGVYNALRDSTSDYKNQLNKCMDLFDTMLQDDRFRNSAIKVMKDFDS